MAGEVSVGAIGAGDSLRLGPSDDTSDGRRHDLVCLYPVLRRICSIPCSFDITRVSSLVVTHHTPDVRVTLYRPGTP